MEYFKDKLFLNWLIETEKESIGYLSYLGKGLNCFYVLGKPWLDNKPNISRVPCGVYAWRLWESPTFKTTVIRLEDVPGRTNILIHPLNYYFQSQGCMGIGKNLSDINGDGEIDIASSRKALMELINLIPNEGLIYIHDVNRLK